jgi:hypothetical protein
MKFYRQKGLFDVIRLCYKWDEAFGKYFQVVILGFGLTIKKK